MLRRLMLSAIFVLLFAFNSFAQSSNPATRPNDSKSRDRLSKEDDQEVSVPEDMRIKMAIMREENDYKKTLEDVEKMNDLSNEVSKTYLERKKLSGDDFKKLGAIEKLAKRVLNHAGGDEVEDKTCAEHFALPEAIDKLNAAAARIKKDMTAETRFVVSATVIANSNEIITLSRLIRRPPKAN